MRDICNTEHKVIEDNNAPMVDLEPLSKSAHDSLLRVLDDMNADASQDAQYGSQVTKFLQACRKCSTLMRADVDIRTAKVALAELDRFMEDNNIGYIGRLRKAVNEWGLGTR